LFPYRGQALPSPDIARNSDKRCEEDAFRRNCCIAPGSLPEARLALCGGLDDLLKVSVLEEEPSHYSCQIIRTRHFF
jgi:hypothetical protein